MSDLNPWLIGQRMTDALAVDDQAIGFRTGGVRYANRYLGGNPGIGETFLLNTRQHSHQAEANASTLEYFSANLGPVIARSGSESTDGAETRLLPDPATLQMGLSTVFDNRRSSRVFSGDSMELTDLATVLHAAAGITHEGVGRAIDRPAEYRFHYRGVPSSGGLYSVDCYCLALRVDGLPAGVYRYLPFTHEITRVGAEPAGRHDLVRPFWQEEAAGIDYGKLAAALLFVGNPHKLTRKYGERGVRYMLIETGMLAYAANLAATALGWGTLDYQSYDDPAMEQCVELHDSQRYVLHSLLLGWPVNTGNGG
jgi:SagB-type dehydrogenase family enzyme